MPLYRVTFTEHGGYRCTCRIRAATGADHLRLAVCKVWGEQAVWVQDPTEAQRGRIAVQVGEEAEDLSPRTGLMTVEIRPVRHAHR